MSSITGYNVPKGYKPFSLPTMDPQSAALHDQLVKLIGPGAGSSVDFLSKIAGGNEGAFQQSEAPAWNALESGMGMAGTRYSNLGMGAQRSSGFKQAMGGMVGQFGQDLQSRRMALQQQAMQSLLGMSQSLMGTPTQSYGMAQKAPSFWEQLLPSLMGGMGSAGSQMGMMGFGKYLGMF